MAEALGGQGFAAPVTTPVGPPQLGTAPLTPVTVSPLPSATTSTLPASADLASIQRSLFPGDAAYLDPMGSSGYISLDNLANVPNPVASNPYSVYGGPTPSSTIAEAALVPGYNTTLGAASAAAGLSPGLTSAYMTGAIPEFAGLGFGASAPATTGASFLGAGALGPLALAGGLFMAMKGMKKTIPP